MHSKPLVLLNKSANRGTELGPDALVLNALNGFGAVTLAWKAGTLAIELHPRMWKSLVNRGSRNHTDVSSCATDVVATWAVRAVLASLVLIDEFDEVLYAGDLK